MMRPGGVKKKFVVLFCVDVRIVVVLKFIVVGFSVNMLGVSGLL